MFLTSCFFLLFFFFFVGSLSWPQAVRAPGIPLCPRSFNCYKGHNIFWHLVEPLRTLKKKVCFQLTQKTLNLFSLSWNNAWVSNIYSFCCCCFKNLFIYFSWRVITILQWFFAKSWKNNFILWGLNTKSKPEFVSMGLCFSFT